VTLSLTSISYYCISERKEAIILSVLQVSKGLKTLSIYSLLYSIKGTVYRTRNEQFCMAINFEIRQLARQIVVTLGLLGQKFVNSDYIAGGIEFGYKLICSYLSITHYVATYKIIYIYCLNKLHDSLNKSCD
jgi:hypothetical protein